MLLSVLNITKAYGPKQVLNNVSFVLNPEQRTGLVGANGVGKSTLLKIIVGEIEPDSGEVVFTQGSEIGYLPQTITILGDKSIDDVILEAQGNLRQMETHLRRLEQEMSRATGDALEVIFTEYTEVSERFERRGGYEIDHKIDIVLDGLRLGNLSRDRKIATLSGGEKSRVGLAALLLQSPDLLLLDEPTNHLDFFAQEWLESYLQGYSGTLLMASHDRHFLNKTTNVILEIDEHSHDLKRYPGNYDAYVVSKETERANWEEAFEEQQEGIKELRQAINTQAHHVGHNRPARDRDKITHKFFGERVQKTVSRNVRAAEEKLDRILANPIPRPPAELRINPGFDPKVLEGKTPLVASRIHKAFDNHQVLGEVSFALRPDSHIVLLGPNGAGKSTLLKILAGVEVADGGEVVLAPSVKIGYLDQEQETLDLNQNTFDAYREGLVGYEEDLRSALFRYALFTHEELNSTVGELSVGQKRKLQLARLIAVQANLLLLDEPTNHISFDILEEFEKALTKFPGPIIAVSHDRRFVERFAREVWELREGRLILHEEGFESYLTSLDSARADYGDDL